MRTALALVAALGLASIVSAQGNPVPVTPANTVQVTIAGNPIWSGTVVCGYTGNGTTTHQWTAIVPASTGAAVIRVNAPSQVPPGAPFAGLMVTLGANSAIPTAPWWVSTANLNGPTWNESMGGTTIYNPGTVTIRGM